MNLTHTIQKRYKTLRTFTKLGKQRIAYMSLIAFAYFFVFGVKVTHAFVGATALTWLGNGFLSALKWLGYLVLASWVVGMILWFSSSLFNTVLDTTVLRFASLLGSAGTEGTLMNAIYTIWTASRDIANILIIGIFVYIAISKIIGRAKDFNKMIVSLLSVAILINFSFFFTQTAIDISNWSAVQVYNAISPQSAANDTADNTVRLAETIIYNMGGVEAGIGALKQSASFFGKNPIQGAMDFIPYMVVTTILTLITAILFFRMVFILFGRWLVLVVLMATSSLAFAAMLIPSLKGYWETWYKGLLYNAIVAPLLLLLLWAVTLLMIGISIPFKSSWGNTAPSLAKIAAGQVSSGGFLLGLIGFILTIGLLWAAIRIATMLSEKASKEAGQLGSLVSSGLGHFEGLGYKGLFGGMGWAGRNTAGRGFASMGEKFEGLAAKSTSRMGGALYGSIGKSLGNLGKKGYDPRALKGFNKAAQGAGMKNTGKAIKDGFAKIAEKKDKEKKDLLDKSQNIRNEALEGDGDTQRFNEQQEKQLKQQKEIAEKTAKDTKEAYDTQTSAIKSKATEVKQAKDTGAALQTKVNNTAKEIQTKRTQKKSLEANVANEQGKLNTQKRAIEAAFQTTLGDSDGTTELEKLQQDIAGATQDLENIKLSEDMGVATASEIKQQKESNLQKLKDEQADLEKYKSTFTRAQTSQQVLTQVDDNINTLRTEHEQAMKAMKKASDTQMAAEQQLTDLQYLQNTSMTAAAIAGAERDSARNALRAATRTKKDSEKALVQKILETSPSLQSKKSDYLDSAVYEQLLDERGTLYSNGDTLDSKGTERLNEIQQKLKKHHEITTFINTQKNKIMLTKDQRKAAGAEHDLFKKIAKIAKQVDAPNQTPSARQARTAQANTQSDATAASGGAAPTSNT